MHLQFMLISHVEAEATTAHDLQHLLFREAFAALVHIVQVCSTAHIDRNLI